MTPKSQVSKTLWKFLIVFAACFLFAGLLTGATLIGRFNRYFKIQSWKKTPATIVRVDLDGDDKGTVEYKYHYQGQEYTGDELHLNGDAQFLKKSTIRQLQEHHKSGKPLPCYVNPNLPDEAILYRNAPWQSIFTLGPVVLLFGGIGLALLVGLFVYRRHEQKKEQLAQAHPDEPWLWRSDWATGRIQASSKDLILLLCFLVFGTLIATPFVSLFSLKGFENEDSVFPWLVIFFVGAVLIGFVALILVMRRRRKYGRAVFELASTPGVIGGQLAGVIHCPSKIRYKEAFFATLRCIETTQDSDDSTPHIRWENEQLIAHDLIQNDPQRTAIPILFAIPYGCCPSGERSSNNNKKGTRSTIDWCLEVKAQTTGLGYLAKFEVPVFRTPQSDPHFAVDQDLLAQYAAPEDPQQDLHDAGVVKTSLPDDGIDRYIFSRARNISTAMPFTFLAILFGAIPFLMLYFEPGWFVQIFFSIFSSFFSLLMIALLLETWLYHSSIDVSSRGLKITAGYLGQGKQHWIDAEAISKIKMTSNMQDKKRKYYDIIVVCKNGKRITGNRLATSLIRQIEQSLSL